MSKLDIIKEFNKQCGDIVNTALTISEKYTSTLDDCIHEVKELLQNTSTLSNDDLEKYIALLPVLMYELIHKMQVLGVRVDAAKTQKKTRFNTAYMHSDECTVAAKTSDAQLMVEEEQFIEDIYIRVYKQCEKKLDIADMLHSSLKKLMNLRLNEFNVTRNNMLSNGRDY
jgi:hypothetical protein